MRSRAVAAGIGIVAAAAMALPVVAQNYPSKPIELVVPFVAGGTTDNIARLMAQRFTESWSQTVIVNNRPGAGSTIGTSAVAKAAPDGHTLLVTTFAFAAAPALQKVSFDPIKDFAPITEIASLPMMLVVHPSIPAKNLAEFIALAKASPAGLDYASSGPGTSTHLAAEMFNTMANVRLVHVPYKGNAEVFNALLGGHIKVHFSLVPIGHPACAGREAARARGHQREAPAVSAGRADHRRVRLPGLRDQLVAGHAGAGRNAAGGRDEDQQRDGRAPEDAGDARAHGARGRRSGRQLAAAIRRARRERGRQMGEGGESRRPDVELSDQKSDSPRIPSVRSADAIRRLPIRSRSVSDVPPPRLP